MIKIGVINVSDRASAGIYEDIPGKAVVELLKEYLISDVDVVYAVLADEEALLGEAQLCVMLPLKLQKLYAKR